MSNNKTTRAKTPEESSLGASSLQMKLTCQCQRPWQVECKDSRGEVKPRDPRGPWRPCQQARLQPSAIATSTFPAIVCVYMCVRRGWEICLRRLKAQMARVSVREREPERLRQRERESTRTQKKERESERARETHTYSHTFTHIHTHTHAHTLTHIHTHANINTQTQTHTHKPDWGQFSKNLQPESGWGLGTPVCHHCTWHS